MKKILIYVGSNTIYSHKIPCQTAEVVWLLFGKLTKE